MTYSGRVLVGVLFSLALVVAVGRASPATAEARPVDDGWTREIVCVGAPMTNRLAVCMDATGSMSGAPFEKAMREVLTILGMFPDDGLLKVYAFRVQNVHSPWPGLPQGGPQRIVGSKPLNTPWRTSWTQLPDSEALEELAAWMAAEVGCGGHTDLRIAIDEAVKNPEEDLSILLVSDGVHLGPSGEAVVATVATAKKRGIPIHTIAIAEGTGKGVPLMSSIAKQTGGACIAWSREGPR